MSRLSSNFTKHKKDNYSLDIKGIYKVGSIQTPFVKKRDIDQRFFLRLRTQAAHNSSMQSSDKQIDKKQKRRFSLTKAFKINNSVGIENHLNKQKIKKVNQLFTQEKYQECLIYVRQMLIREQNQYVKNRLFWINANCLKKIGKIKEAQHFLTRLINQQPDNYEALILRGKLRYLLGAKQLSWRDLKHAIYINQQTQIAYIQLCNLYLQDGDQKQAYSIATTGVQKGIQSVQLLLIVIELLLTNKNLTLSSDQRASFYIQKIQEQIGHSSKDSADFLYLQALLLETKQKLNEACIYYEECLKYNNSKYSVTRSLQRLILIKILQRDYYSAYHTVNRYKILNIQTKIIYPYILFLQGVILVMKKKFSQGIRLLDALVQVIDPRMTALEKSQIFLQNILRQSFQNKPNNKQKSYIMIQSHHKCTQTVLPLLYKFCSYGCFKLGNHQKCIEYYQKLSQFGMDEPSSYNLLLAEGIIAVEKRKNFQLGMQKFEQARYVYPCKVQPNIYIAMTVIFRDLCISGMLNSQNGTSQTLTSAVIHAMEELNEAHEMVNDSSSNLLYHRCLLNFYMEDWDSALSDINLCIEKAQQNQPKYFYIRGLAYAIIKQLRKAINQYSISLSLDGQFHKSLLERSKCYFLLGQTEAGFADLKQYMYKNPSDYHVHKWIGDLLYQGRSYSDALKAYSQIDDCILFNAQVMKCKSLMRTSDINKIGDSLTKMSKLQDCVDAKIQVDILAINLLKILTRPHENKQTSSKIKRLNALLEENCVGYIFGLVDCMNLLGVATLDAGRYEEAYQSFLLVLQLYTTLSQKNKSQLKSDCSEEGLSLTIQQIYINIFYSLLGMKDYESACRIVGQQLLSCTNNIKIQQKLYWILQKYKQQNDETLQAPNLETDMPKNDKFKLKQVSLKLKNIRVKGSPIFSLFHASVEDLYSRSIAQRLIRDLKPSYIDNMPEGPWIKRNQHGVIFTDQILEDEMSSDFLSTMRAKQSQSASSMEQNSRRDRQNQQSLQHQKRQEVKQKLLLDQDVERKLNNIIKKNKSNLQA